MKSHWAFSHRREEGGSRLTHIGLMSRRIDTDARLAGGFAPAAVVCLFAAMSAGPAFSNGWMESRSWQFDTSADKANKAAVLDLIERKKGGYYDGFSTTINNHNITNIGTQINCNNTAEATGNIAANTQGANSPQVSTDADVSSSASGNDATNSGTGRGGTTRNDQDNSGDVSAGVSGSDASSVTGHINVGDSLQDLQNNQDNSGDQLARVVDSTACDMSGSSLTGHVRSNLTAPLN